MSKTTRSFLQWMLPAIVLFVGAGAAAALVMMRQSPEPENRPTLGPLVEVIQVESSDLSVKVEGQGEVRASTRVEVLPEVSGRVVRMHPQMVSGGRIAAGETLVQLDPRDYTLAVESAQASITSAETRLEVERAEAEAALVEWRAVNGDAAPPPLLVREPQIRQIEAELSAARAQLQKAELDLERTRLTVPFDAVVLTENVDPGQLVSQGRAVATLYGTGAVEVRVPLADDELRWFELPRRGAERPTAAVRSEFGGRLHRWPATVARLEGEVDPRTRMVRVVVEVEDPFDGETPLLPGAFVDIEIDGRTLEDIIRIPRFALRQGSTVWTVVDGQLRINAVEVARSDRLYAYVASGLDAGSEVITSSLDGVVDGMSVRTSLAPTESVTDSAAESVPLGEA
ncbi:MAG: efflux RND transporter periplasmic adaptor subunit [Acidobacteriota bacterium]